MKRGITTEYFGASEPLLKENSPNLRSALEFDDKNIENISRMVFHGMRGGDYSKKQLTKHDMRVWTKQIMAWKHPNVPFSEENFEKGFKWMDVNKDGKLDEIDIKEIVMKKVKREGLYAGTCNK